MEILDAVIPPEITSKEARPQELRYHVRFERPQSLRGACVGANGSVANGGPSGALTPSGVKSWLTYDELGNTRLYDKVGQFLLVRSVQTI